jgi:hypothetical protein
MRVLPSASGDELGSLYPAGDAHPIERLVRVMAAVLTADQIESGKLARQKITPAFQASRCARWQNSRSCQSSRHYQQANISRHRHHHFNIDVERARAGIVLRSLW